MRKRIAHPASSLPEQDRTDYLATVAAMALVDGRADPVEVARLRRLGAVLRLGRAEIDRIVRTVTEGRAETLASDEVLARLSARPQTRSSLMMDAIVIAFCDGQLVRTESQALGLLARRLGLQDEEVREMAMLVENVLFRHRPMDDHALAQQFGEALATGEWLREVSSGEEPAAQG